MNESCKMSDGINSEMEVGSVLSDAAAQISDQFEALADACRRNVKSLAQSHLALASIMQAQADIQSNMEAIYRYKAENAWCYLIQIWYYRKYYKARRARIFMERQVFGLRRFATIIGDNEE